MVVVNFHHHRRDSWIVSIKEAISSVFSNQLGAFSIAFRVSFNSWAAFLAFPANTVLAELGFCAFSLFYGERRVILVPPNWRHRFQPPLPIEKCLYLDTFTSFSL